MPSYKNDLRYQNYVLSAERQAYRTPVAPPQWRYLISRRSLVPVSHLRFAEKTWASALRLILILPYFQAIGRSADGTVSHLMRIVQVSPGFQPRP